MKNTLLSLLTLIILSTPQLLNAQNNLSITGAVTNAKEEPIPYASVVLKCDSSFISGAITNEKGRFALKSSGCPTQHNLTIEAIGYLKQDLPISPTSERFDAGRIILEENRQMIEGISVTAKSEDKRMSVEHTTLSASASVTASQGSVVDILRSAAAVTVDNAGNISIRGNSNVLVLLDGIPTTMTDLTALPAANVKNVEIITNPDASYDAEGTGGIINVVTQKSGASGLSGMVSANYGFTNFTNGNIILRYNAQKASFRFSYNTKYEDDIIDGTLQRVLKGSGKSIAQQIHSARTTYNNNIGLGANFRINPKNLLTVDLRLIIPRLNTQQEFHNTYTSENPPTYEEQRFSDVSWNRENIDGAISYRHVMQPEKSEFTLRASVSKIWGHRPSYYFLEGDSASRSNSGGSPFNTAVQADFKWKFKPGTLDFGAKLTYRQNDIFHEFYNYIDHNWTYSDAFSNDLLHREVIPAAYAMFSGKAGKRFSYKAGVRAEYSVVTLNSKKENLQEQNGDFFISPTLSGKFKINKNQELAFAFSRRISRPAYPQLNPYMSMIDGNTFEQGNMRLKPEKSSNLDLSYSLKIKKFSLFADAYLAHTNNYITQVTRLTEEELLLLTYINGTSDLRSGIDLNLEVTPLRWLKIGISANTFFADARGEFDDMAVNNSGWSNNSNVMLSFQPHKTTQIQLQYFIETPQYYPQFTTALTHSMNIGIKQSFLKGALSASVWMTDVLGTYSWEIHSDNLIFSLENISYNKSRMLWLGISYNFNGFKAGKTAKKEEFDRSRIRIGL